MSRVVLDSSALLAFLNGERGAAIVQNAIADSIMSAVNLAETIGVLMRSGVPRVAARLAVLRTGIKLQSFDADQAEEAGALGPATAALGLSLGDRACLALAFKLQLEVLTADATWSNLRLPVQITLIR